MEIDLNADLGEGAGTDAELMPLVTSANVSCGAHAGDPDTIHETLLLAREHGVVVGAHPGYPDREHFGRRELACADPELEPRLTAQLGGLAAIAEQAGVPVRYLKPHGALYNQACRDAEFARTVVAAAAAWKLMLVGLPGSELQTVSRAAGIPFVAEGFADRRYRPDGLLVPRTEPGAFVEDPAEAVAQIEWLIRDRGVRTICVHGDNPEAVAFVKAVRDVLVARGFTLKPFA